MSYTLEVSVGSKVASSAPPRELLKQKDNGSVLPTETLDASDYHAMASVAELIVSLRDENKKNKYKDDEQQYTYMEFVDKKTGEVSTQRVLF